MVVAFDDIFLFYAADAQGVFHTWRSDGTAAGTTQMAVTSGIGSDPQVVLGHTLFFYSSNDLWKTDGTDAGTSRVKDINPSGPDFPLGINSPMLALVGNKVYFPADDGVGKVGLWMTDGTEANTVLVKEFAPGQSSWPNYIGQLGNVMIFGVRTGDTLTSQIWRTDGTSIGTFMLVDQIVTAGFDSVVNNTLFFSAYTDQYQNELWKTDGTIAGTGIVKDINPGGGMNGGSFPRNLMSFNGHLFFTVFDVNDPATTLNFNFTQSGLWITDGTDAGTKRIEPSYSKPYINGFTVESTMFFFIYGSDLYKSDGTAQGTVSLPVGQRVYQILGHSNGVIFFTTSVSGDENLWRSDGTAAGTTLLQSLGTTYVTPVAQNQSHIFFLGFSNDGFYRLWSGGLNDLLSVRAPITAMIGGEVKSLDGQVTVTFAPGSVSSDLTAEIRSLSTPTQDTGTRHAVSSFTLEAVDSTGAAITKFSKPYTLTLSYSDAEVTGLFEPGINVAYWNGTAWVNLLPCTGCSIDAVNNRITVQVDHFTEFALLGNIEYRSYLPLIQR